ncbi:MAG TPA: DoxX family membrane protein [Ohtaekwangia sp.]|nr:DoxX family membrane protein [Ohtaekwangia sp.]
MATKVKSIAIIAGRTALGLIFFVFGLNFFLHFIPMPPPPDTPGVAEAFTGGLFQSGYFFPMLKGIEVVLGFLLIIGLFVPLSLVILMPISLNILLFHAFLAPESLAMSVVILILNLFVAWGYRDHYKSLFHSKSTLSL